MLHTYIARFVIQKTTYSMDAMDTGTALAKAMVGATDVPQFVPPGLPSTR